MHARIWKVARYGRLSGEGCALAEETSYDNSWFTIRTSARIILFN